MFPAPDDAPGSARLISPGYVAMTASAHSRGCVAENAGTPGRNGSSTAERPAESRIGQEGRGSNRRGATTREQQGVVEVDILTVPQGRHLAFGQQCEAGGGSAASGNRTSAMMSVSRTGSQGPPSASVPSGRREAQPLDGVRPVRCRESLADRGFRLTRDFLYPDGVADFRGFESGRGGGLLIFTPRPAARLSRRRLVPGCGANRHAARMG